MELLSLSMYQKKIEDITLKHEAPILKFQFLK